MTVSEAVIEWLKGFNSDEHQKMNPIDTDKQSAEVDSYSLVKEPIRNEKSYITGRKEFTDHYMIQARLSTQTNTERIENNSFGEALEGWVMEQNQKKNFPVLADATVKEVSVTTPFYMGKTETNNSVYQMTVALKYEKEGDLLCPKL